MSARQTLQDRVEYGLTEKLWGVEIATEELCDWLKEIDRLRDALNRAGDALVKVQPAIDVDCTWALFIVPEAEAEIEAALAEEGTP